MVVDTNVFVSAALKGDSLPALAIRLALRQGTLLKSSATEDQLKEVLRRPYLARLMAPTAVSWIAEILANAENISVSESVVACRDPTDDKFLELAVNGNATLIITGDADLLVLHPFRGISIIKPAEFLLDWGDRD